VQFNVFSSTLKVCRYLGHYSWYQSQVYFLVILYKAKHLKLHLGLQLKFDTLMHNRMGCMGIFCFLSFAVYFPLCAYSSYVNVLLIVPYCLFKLLELCRREGVHATLRVGEVVVEAVVMVEVMLTSRLTMNK